MPWLQLWNDPFLHHAFPLPQGPGFDRVHDEDDDEGNYLDDDDYEPIVEEEYEFSLDDIQGDDGYELDKCTICNGLWIECLGCQPQAPVNLRETTPFRQHAREVRRRQRRANETEAEREERIHVRNQHRLNPPAPRDREFWEDTSEEDTSEEDIIIEDTNEEDTSDKDDQGEGKQVGQEEETEAGQTNYGPHDSGPL